MNTIRLGFTALREQKHRDVAHKIDFVLRSEFRTWLHSFPGVTMIKLYSFFKSLRVSMWELVHTSFYHCCL